MEFDKCESKINIETIKLKLNRLYGVESKKIQIQIIDDVNKQIKQLDDNCELCLNDEKLYFLNEGENNNLKKDLKLYISYKWL